VSLPLDESFGSCLMPSRADVNVSNCELDELIDRCCSSSPINSATLSTGSATEVESARRTDRIACIARSHSVGPSESFKVLEFLYFMLRLGKYLKNIPSPRKSLKFACGVFESKSSTFSNEDDLV